MLRTIISSVAISFLFLILPPYAGTGGAPSLLKLNETNNAQTVELDAGQKLDIVLNENATTGYQWEIVSIDNAILEQAAEPEFKLDSDLIGAGGKKIFHFRATTLGKTNLKLIYHRSWEKNVPPVKTFEITIIVK